LYESSAAAEDSYSTSRKLIIKLIIKEGRGRRIWKNDASKITIQKLKMKKTKIEDENISVYRRSRNSCTGACDGVGRGGVYGARGRWSNLTLLYG
jgi:hypothetical protein